MARTNPAARFTDKTKAKEGSPKEEKAESKSLESVEKDVVAKKSKKRIR